jgi:hypothetical protein
MRHIAFLAVIILASACASKAPRSGSIADVVGATDANLESEATAVELERDEILRSPLEFDVSIDDDRYSWERTTLFLENYVDPARAPLRPITKVIGSRWGLASPPVQGGLVYEVWREEIPEGFHYKVQCLVSGTASPQQARLNAANLARFIRDGKLEVSLLPGNTPR